MRTGRPLRRISRWLGIGLGAVLLCLILLLTIVLATETGGRVVLGLIDRSDLPVSIGAFSGRLGGSFELRDVHVAAPPVEATVDRLTVVWHPLQLTRRRLVVERALLSGAEVSIGEPPAPQATVARADTTVPGFALPIDILIGELVVERGSVTLPGDVRVDGVRLRAGGRPEAYDLEASCRVSTPTIADIVVGLRATGTIDHAVLDSLRVDLLDGRVITRGRVSWMPEVTWEVETTADGIAPAALLPEPAEWPGAVAFHLASNGRLTDTGPTATVHLDHLEGALRDQPLGGSARIRLTGSRVDVEDLDLSWGVAGLRLAGRIADTIELDLAVDSDDLGAALPGMAGALHLEGHAGGPRATPRVAARLRGDRLEVGQHRVGSVQGDIEVDLAGDLTLDCRIEALRVEAAGQAIDSLRVELRGTLNDHRLSVAATSDSLGLSLELDLAGGIAGNLAGGLAGDRAGSIADSTWHGRLERLDLTTAVAGNWSLVEPALLSASKTTASLTGFCLLAEDAEMCAEGAWQLEGRTRARLQIAALPLALAGPFLPAGTTIDGALGADIDAEIAPDSRLTAQAEISIGPGTFATQVGEPPQSIRFDTAVHATADDAGVRADVTMNLSTGTGDPFGELRAALVLPELTHLASLTDTTRPQPLSATLELHLTEMGPLSTIVPQLGDPAGRLDVVLEATGHLHDPTVSGRLEFRDGRVDIAEAGLELRDIQLAVRGDRSGSLAIEGAVRSGAGHLSLTTESTLLPSREVQARVHVQGERFEIMETPEIHALISPDLELWIDGRSVDVQGEVVIPLTTVELKQVPPTAVGVSRDAQFVDAEIEPPPPPIDVTTHVRVVLGDSVSFRGFGFSSHLAGHLLVIEEPGRPPSATGELRIVSGRFKAYGQDLIIDPGRIIFAGGPVDNPGLNMRAYRQADDGVIAGLRITGRAKAPQMTIYSEPTMAEGDALAYIMLGHPLGQGGGDRSLVANAANSLGLKGGNYLARSLGSKVGLDEARIESEGPIEEASLVTGKYLSPELYVSYGVGLFDKVNTFRVRYLMSRRWTVQAETGRGTGADLMYQLERGR